MIRIFVLFFLQFCFLAFVIANFCCTTACVMQIFMLTVLSVIQSNAQYDLRADF